MKKANHPKCHEAFKWFAELSLVTELRIVVMLLLFNIKLNYQSGELWFSSRITNVVLKLIE